MSAAAPRAGRTATWILVAAAVVALAAALWTAIDALPALPVNVVIDGETVFSGIDLQALSFGERLLAVGALLVALLTVLLVVPLALLIALGVVLMTLMVVIGAPLLALLAVAALLLSPLLLLGWLLWRALRPSPTIPA